MFKLQKLNVIRIVETEEDKQKLLNKDFVEVLEEKSENVSDGTENTEENTENIEENKDAANTTEKKSKKGKE